jgi:hypothetical protein
MGRHSNAVDKLDQLRPFSDAAAWPSKQTKSFMNESSLALLALTETKDAGSRAHG